MNATDWTPMSDQPSPTAQALTAAHAAQDEAERRYYDAEHQGAGADVLRDLGRQADEAAEAVQVAAKAHRAARDAWTAEHRPTAAAMRAAITNGGGTMSNGQGYAL